MAQVANMKGRVTLGLVGTERVVEAGREVREMAEGEAVWAVVVLVVGMAREDWEMEEEGEGEGMDWVAAAERVWEGEGVEGAEMGAEDVVVGVGTDWAKGVGGWVVAAEGEAERGWSEGAADFGRVSHH